MTGNGEVKTNGDVAPAVNGLEKTVAEPPKLNGENATNGEHATTNGESEEKAATVPAAKKGFSFSKKGLSFSKRSAEGDQGADTPSPNKPRRGLQRMGKSFKEAFAQSSQAQNAKAAKPIPIEYDIEMAGFGFVGVGTALGYHKVGPDHLFAGLIAFGGVLLFISRLVKLSRDHKEWKAKQEKEGAEKTPSPVNFLLLIGATLVLVLIIASDILLLFQLKYPYKPPPVADDTGAAP